MLQYSLEILLIVDMLFDSPILKGDLTDKLGDLNAISGDFDLLKGDLDSSLSCEKDFLLLGDPDNFLLGELDNILSGDNLL